MTIIVSATQLKRQVAEIINLVYYQKKEVVVQRFGKPVVRIVPEGKDKKEKVRIEDKLKKFFGTAKDLPEPRSTRRLRKRLITL